MNNTNSKNLFRKVLSLKSKESVSENINRFRKSIDERLHSTFHQTQKINPVPGHDVMFFE